MWFMRVNGNILESVNIFWMIFYDCQFIWGKSDKNLIQFDFQKFITVHFNVETNFTMFVFVSVRLVSHCQGQSRKIFI